MQDWSTETTPKLSSPEGALHTAAITAHCKDIEVRSENDGTSAMVSCSGDQTRIADFAATPNHTRPAPAAESRQGITPCRNRLRIPEKSSLCQTAGVQPG